jgi:hypothetical protein
MCTCACPTEVTFEADPLDPASVLDTGWTGQAHDAQLITDGLVTVAVSGCDDGVGGPDDRRDPDCGVCALSGPLANNNAGAGEIDSQRCRGDSSIPCTADSDCGGAAPCVFYFGTMLPLSAGGTSTCVINKFGAGITGTADLEVGATATSVDLVSTVFLGPSPDKPCNNCKGDVVVNDGVQDGTCDAGARVGLACDVHGTHPIPAFNGGVPGPGLVNGTSLDCPYAGGSVADLPIDLTNSTGTETQTLVAGSPACTASGFGSSKCMCQTCNTPAGEPCGVDADCPTAGVCRGGTNALEYCQVLADCPDTGPGTACGGAPCSGGFDCASGVCTFPMGFPGECSTLAGKCGGTRCLGGATNPGAPCFFPPDCSGGTAPCDRPGQPTKPHDCLASCSPVGPPGEGECSTGPFNGKCSPTETFRGCTAPSNCTFPGDTCIFPPRECFLDNGIVGGSILAVGAPDAPINDQAEPTLVSTFCIAPVDASAVNLAAGLPGPGRVSLRGLAEGLP